MKDGASIIAAIAVATMLVAGVSGCTAENGRHGPGEFEEIGAAVTGEGSVDLAAYSKLAPWPRVTGDYLYSGCYVKAPLVAEDPGADRCFMVVDVSEPTRPVRVSTIHAYDPQESPPPPPDHVVWSETYPYPNLPVRVPCKVSWSDPAVSSGERPPPCWDPGWNTQTHYVAVVPRRLLAVNQERFRYGTDRQANWRGVRFYDLERPAEPVEVSFWEAPVSPPDPVTGRTPDGGGVHHFNFAGDYLLLGSEYEGFVGRILVILDLENPALPREVTKWWLPGQKTPEEDAERDWAQQRLFSRPVMRTDDGRWSAFVGMHYATVYGDRAYLAYHQAGLVILDVRDIAKPELLSWTNLHRPGADTTNPNHPACAAAAGTPIAACGNTHTAKRVPGRDLLIVENEYFTCPFGHVKIFDVSDDRNPELLSHYLLDETLACAGDNPRAPRNEDRFPLRGPSSHIGNAWNGSIYFVAWYGAGLQAIDIADPANPRFAGEYRYSIGDRIPAQSPQYDGADTYDVVFGPEGVIYVSDGTSGLRVLKYDGAGGSAIDPATVKADRARTRERH